MRQWRAFILSTAAVPDRGAARPAWDLRSVSVAWGRSWRRSQSGALLDHGWAPAQLYYLFSGPFVVAAIAMLIIGRSPRASMTCKSRHWLGDASAASHREQARELRL